eukprot:scaffold46606_cov77-Phaeocystis_antarctica.AAC.3
MRQQDRQQARAEGLTLLVGENKTGYLCVRHEPKSKRNPYRAQVRRSGKDVHLGNFVTAEEAALCVARSPEGQATAAERAAAAPPLTSEEARQQAQAEGLTLHVANNTTGYFGVYLAKPGQPKPYMAQVWRGGNQVHLGSFATAEEAALCVARTPERQAAAAQRPVAAPPLTSEGALQQAQAERLTLLLRVKRGGKTVHLGSFVTAEEAALYVARTPEGQAAAQWAAAAPVPLTSEEARQQAQAEGLTLRVADSTTGYSCVSLAKPGQPKPYQARVSRGGKYAHLGCFVTAEEAALCVARSPEGQAAVEKVAAAPPLTSKEALQQARDTIIGAVALDIIYEAAGAATAELSAEVAAEVVAGIAMGL